MVSHIKMTIILAYKEDVSSLEAALREEGFAPQTQRATYTESELKYSKQSRCFMNHKSAWERAAVTEGYTLICESDFVPCIGLGQFPVFWPANDQRAWGYLYQGSPRLFALVGSPPWFRGHCAPLVAYVVNATVARELLGFFEHELTQYSLHDYFTFDAHLQWFLMGKDCRAYIPLRHYGEHGGIANQEHRAFGLSRGGEHHADNLQGRLHFLPQYAGQSKIRFHGTRLKYRILGWLRLFSGRWIVKTHVYEVSLATRIRMMAWGIARLL